MFTGLIEELGQVHSWKRKHAGYSLALRGEKVIKELVVGDSVAVNGVCLTVTVISGYSFETDVMPETMRLTNLGELKPGNYVNLERAMMAGGRFGGHFVSGHIDGTGSLVSSRPEANAVLMSFSAPENITDNIIKKGSVAVDGVSLTVVEAGAGRFVVSLVAHTLAVTTLGLKQPGERVNLETDMLGKYVEKYLELYLAGRSGAIKREQKSNITKDFLQEKGFF